MAGLFGPHARNQEVELSPLKSRRRAGAERSGGGGAAAQRAGNAARPHIVSELERLLRTPGCPACRYIDESERSFFSWLEIESFSVAEVQARVRAAMGMCPAHSRRLVDEFGEGHVMTIVMREALAGARLCVRDELVPGPCPACDAVAFGTQRACQMIVDAVSDPVRGRLFFEHGGICLVHFLDAAPVLEPTALKLLADRLLRTLLESEGSVLVEMLGGVDPDAQRRARWRALLPEPPGASSTLDEVCARFEIDACPVCLSTGLVEREYLRWHVERTAQNDPSLRNDPGELCARHLHDLAFADAVLAAQATERKRAAGISKLTRLDETPATGRDGLLTTPYCPACNAHDGIERSQLDFVAASLALSSARERYERGHGLCVHHSRQVPDGPAARLARRHLDGRLGVLAWEVGEIARKYAWAYRHERDGHERNAWLRALAQIDGRVFEGGPAPTRAPERA